MVRKKVRRRTLRAIPTCVGTTPPGASRPSPGAGHPHVCGDYRSSVLSLNTMTGPSPRVWGLRLPVASRDHLGRAIPTCVGTTWSSPMGVSPSLGHPHVCGDYGSSPEFGTPPGRAIPTCVGTTRKPRVHRGRNTGHPHVCGDYTLTKEVKDAGGGPSPRVWGLRAASIWAWAAAGPSPRVWGLHMTQTAKTPADPPLCVCKGGYSRQ